MTHLITYVKGIIPSGHSRIRLALAATRIHMVDRIYGVPYIVSAWKCNVASFFSFYPMTHASAA